MNLNNDKRHICIYCDRTYKHKHHLTHHQKKCKENPNNYFWDKNGTKIYCPKTSKKNEISIPQRHECPFCKKSYKQKSHMTRHLRYRCKIFNRNIKKSSDSSDYTDDELSIDGIDENNGIKTNTKSVKKSFIAKNDNTNRNISVTRVTRSNTKVTQKNGKDNTSNTNNKISQKNNKKNKKSKVADKYKCKYCNLGFVHKNILYRHMKHYLKYFQIPTIQTMKMLRNY